MIALRNRFRRDWMESELLLAGVVYELAGTYEKRSDDHKKQLKK